MQKYIGTKIVQAEARQKDGEHGFDVVYPDGYRSWSPEAAFLGAYRPIEGGSNLSFDDAIALMKQGYPVARAGWNGRGMCIYFTTGSIDADLDEVPDMVSGIPSRYFQRGDSETITRLPHLSMINADGHIVTGWLASQTDMLAEDWMVAA